MLILTKDLVKQIKEAEYITARVFRDDEGALQGEIYGNIKFEKYGTKVDIPIRFSNVDAIVENYGRMSNGKITHYAQKDTIKSVTAVCKYEALQILKELIRVNDVICIRFTLQDSSTFSQDKGLEYNSCYVEIMRNHKVLSVLIEQQTQEINGDFNMYRF